jgi:hypothetical protein
MADGVGVTLWKVEHCPPNADCESDVWIARMRIVGPDEGASAFIRDGVFPIGRTVGWTAGLYCLPAEAGHDAHGPQLESWNAMVRGGDPDRWHVLLASFAIDGTRLRSVGLADYRVPEDQTALPADDGQTTLCGAPTG